MPPATYTPPVAPQAYKQIEGGLSQWIFFQCRGVDGRGRIALFKRGGYCIRFRYSPAAMQKLVQTRQTTTGQDVFVRGPAQFLHQPMRQLKLQSVSRSEVHMPAFRGHNQLLLPTLQYERLAKAGARAQDHTRAVAADLACLQHQHVFFVKLRNAMTHGFKIVHQAQMRHANGVGQLATGDDPRQVGDVNPILCATALNRPRNRKAGGIDNNRRPHTAKIGYDLGKARVFATLEALFRKDTLHVARTFGEQQPGVRAADVTGQVVHGSHSGWSLSNSGRSNALQFLAKGVEWGEWRQNP